MIAMSRFIFVFSLMIAAGIYVQRYSNSPVPIARPLAEFPTACAGWQMSSQSVFSEEVLKLIRPTDYLYRQYDGPAGEKISLYVGYHNGGKESGEVHSPRNCLPGNGWQEISSGRIYVATDNGKVQCVRAVYQKNDNKELFLYWFQSQGKTLTDEISLKLSQSLSAITQQRRDTAFVRISIPVSGDEERAKATGEKFIRDFYPKIRSYLPV